MALIIAWTDVNHHRNERFSDLYIMDKVWATKRIWREQIKSVELSPFQEALLESGLRDFHEPADKMPGCADIPIGFTSLMAGECFEVIGELTDEMIHNDLLVRRLPVCFCLKLRSFLQRCQDHLDVDQLIKLIEKSNQDLWVLNHYLEDKV